ncbi:transposase, partial [Candidatus Woesearchaeota archaeon]|nr:transposase [Candidatus Woesearchaeota archaeon]
MKLTKGKLMETIRRKNEGWTTYQARKIAGISIRRVNQVWGQYTLSGVLPEIGRKMGRPPIKASPEEIELVQKAYREYRVSATTLEHIIERDYGKHIPHNRIHAILVAIGLAKKLLKKFLRKKDWIRYERRHSLTAVHIDWHYYGGGIWVFAVIDDASRKLLALVECQSPTTEESIKGMQIALKHGRIRQCISDHGSQFTANIIDGNSQFKEFLNANAIKQILCRIKHPQSNGKVEKWFETYDNHRFAFATIEEFMRWYNEKRPHRSLNFAILETPQQAFVRKMKAE